jgi:hypothetical protein
MIPAPEMGERMRSWVKAVCAVVMLGVLLTASRPSRADNPDPAHLMVGGGAWEALRDVLRVGEGDIAYRFSDRWWIFKPHVGLVVAGDGDVLGYGGVLIDLYFGPHVVTTLSSSVGLWAGHGFNLGSRVEFRSGVDAAWRFDDASRLGVGFYHTSNADLTNRNPGSESLLVVYSIPITHWLGR